MEPDQRAATAPDLAIHEHGDRGTPTVVLLHGLSESGAGWPDLVDRWPDRHILAPDLRGHGASPRFTPEQLTRVPEVMVADVVALLDAQDRPVDLIGHSLGGNLALHAALARPDRVRALVLEDPARPGRHPDPEFVAEIDSMLVAVMTDRAREVARMAHETPWSAAEIEVWADAKPLVDRRYVHAGLSLGAPAWEELFEALTCPTLLVLPPDAPMAPRGVRNPLVSTVVIAGTGHCVRRDRPEEFFRAVEAFLAAHP